MCVSPATSLTPPDRLAVDPCHDSCLRYALYMPPPRWGGVARRGWFFLSSDRGYSVGAEWGIPRAENGAMC